jgi:sigma-B regulation protein RsbU (phosphoserine phosphatase)
MQPPSENPASDGGTLLMPGQDQSEIVAVPTEASAARSRVLLVEDDPLSLKILKKRIGNGGFHVETAVDGADGLEKYKQFRPDMIISDWMMPRMNGDEFCKRLKQEAEGESIYFILLTARDKHEDIVKALDFGADEYLVKPCDGLELMARLRAADRFLRLQKALSLSNQQLTQANERINKELRDISSIQRSLLPQRLPQAPGYHFAAHYQPSTECSGDFYDLLQLDDGRLGVVIGDVSGHGAAAMVAMALVRTLYRMESHATYDPAQFLSNINANMFAHLPTGQYATMFYGVLDLKTGRLDYSSAGHPPPLLCNRESGEVKYLDGCEGFPIKLVDPVVEYFNRRIDLPTGHNLVLYTDGLTETFNEEDDFYGTERFSESATELAGETPDQFIADLLGRLDDYRGSRAFCDDLSLLIVGRD